MRTFAQERKTPQRRNPVLHLKKTDKGHPGPRANTLLHWQHTLGNQAVLRMLQRGTLVQRQPKTPPQKAKNLKDSGVGLSDPVAGNTAQIIDAVLQRNKKLAPYIGDRLKGGFQIGEKGKFVKDLNDGNFETAYRGAYDVPKSDPVPAHVMGFYDRKKNTIHLRPKAEFGTALHEAVHKLASPTFFDRFLTVASQVSKSLVEVLLEGFTAYFTDTILHEEQLPSYNSYADLKNKAEQMVKGLGPNGFDLMAKFNFKGAGLIEIGNQLGLTTQEYTRLQAGAGKEVLRRMNKLL